MAGIGALTAEKIIGYRDQVGLSTMKDLLNVPGMTKRLFFILEDCCELNGD